ncbi:MAG: universal stress protein [Bradymonadales bacterium]|nr:universal stress protein [Bradymonadales bacterium]
MRHWAHIVVLVDLSESSRVALRIAEQLAAAFGAELHSSHVVGAIPPLLHRVLYPYAALGEDLVEFEQELVGTARSELRRVLAQEEENPVHPSSVVCAPIPEGLLQEISRFQADLVVMGSRGERGPNRTSLGSTARDLVDRWTGPLLLVRPGVAANTIQRIVVATDLVSSPEVLIATAYQLSHRMNVPLAVLTVMHDPRVTEERGGLLKGVAKVDARSSLSKGKRIAKGHLDRIVKNLSFPFPDKEALNRLEPELIVRFGEPGEQIQEVVGGLDGLLLILGRAQTEAGPLALLGHTCEALLRLAPSHILLVPS